MFKVALKGVLAHKRRLLSTSLAVLLGVSFLCGTLVLGDTIQRSFSQLLSTANAGTDAYVRSASSIPSGEPGGGRDRGHIDASLVDVVRKVPGVAAAEPDISGRATILDKSGVELGSGGLGPPTRGGVWQADTTLNAFQLSDGTAPVAADDVVIDRASARTADYHVGDTVTIALPEGEKKFHLSGIAKFGTQDSPGGATYALFTLPTAEQLLVAPGKVDAIIARADPGISQDDLVARIRAAVPADNEVITGAAITKDQQDAIQSRISGFTKFFSAFGYIAVLVGMFVIYNTFAILIAQRTRETALLRAVGAGRGQVVGSVLLEALAVGVIASTAGVALGVGVGAGLRALFGAAGLNFPNGGLVVKPSTIIIGFVAGTLVTTLAAALPAVRASRVSPLAALREVAVDTSNTSRRRLVIGLIVTAFGLLQIVRGVSATDVGPIGIGAVFTLIGMIVLGPIVARPLSRVLGAPAARWRGISGGLARQNAMRNPRRTSTTASALMVGVAVVTLFTVMAASLKATTADQIKTSFSGDLAVSTGGFGRGGLSPALDHAVAALPEVDAAAPVRISSVAVKGESTELLATDPAALLKVLKVTVQEGSFADVGANAIAVSDTKAKDDGLHLGDTVPVTYADTGEHDLRITAVFKTNDVLDTDYLVSTALDDVSTTHPLDRTVLIKLKSGVSLQAGKAAVHQVAASYPTAKVQDIQGFVQGYTSRINTFLYVIFGMLTLSILIASIGISNTLQLSIHERTREIGLLRAVGTTREQLRTMVRWESAIIALFGTLGGLLLGASFGWAIVHGLGKDQNVLFRLPVGQALIIVAIGALVGLLASVRPARRAAKLDVLLSIASE